MNKSDKTTIPSQVDLVLLSRYTDITENVVELASLSLVKRQKSDHFSNEEDVTRFECRSCRQYDLNRMACLLASLVSRLLTRYSGRLSTEKHAGRIQTDMVAFILLRNSRA